MLPSRDVAEGLVKDYFTREHVNLPIVNYPGFCSRLAKLQTSGIPMTNMHIFQSLVNAVFAVGCISAHPENRHDASTYFERAYRLLRLVDSDDLTGVQAHLVCSQYLFAVGKLESAWKSVEIAIREAQSLRLNLQSASHHLEDKAHRELVRRVWHCCILLERSYKLTPLLESVH